VLVDAPCTGLGTLRRNPDLKWRQTPEALAALGEQQRAILEAAARLLKPGGRLVYATCSPLLEEDEEVAAAFDAGALGGSFSRLPAAGAAAARPGGRRRRLVSGPDLRLWTHRHGSDGFFAAAWERRAS
jgi:16S rRNA (cytosine967-C5)-methyltransferase